MSSEVANRTLRLLTFAATTSLSLTFTSALLRVPFGRGLVGLALIGGLLLAVLYLSAKYLVLLWMFSDKLSTLVVGKVGKLIAGTATHSAEKA